MGCPFGCVEAHRKRAAAQRCAQYRRTVPGKTTKRQLNRKRYLIGLPEDPVPPSEVEIDLEEEVHKDPMVTYVRMVTSLIEDRWISLEEILEMLKRISRQLPLTRRRQVDYYIDQLNKGPP